MSSSPLVSSLVKSTVQDGTRYRWAAVSIHPHYGFVCGGYDAVWQPRSRNSHVWDLGCLKATSWTQESLAFLHAAVQLLHVRCLVCWILVHCPAGTQSRYQTLCVSLAASSMTSLWRREASSKKSVRDITRISCFVTTMKLPHALQIYWTVFVKKCMRLHISR